MLFERATTGADIESARMIACDYSLRIRSAAHESDRKACIAGNRAALSDRENERQPALIERFRRHHEHKPRTALLGAFRRIEVNMPNLASIRDTHQMISLPTGFDASHSRSSRPGRFLK